MKPSVSIVIPCFNEEKTIRNLLKAICAQTYPISRLEVVIADGFSTDDTRQVDRRLPGGKPPTQDPGGR